MDKPIKPEKIAIKAKRESVPQSAARSDVSSLSLEHTSMFFAVLADLQRSFGRVEAKVEGLGDRIGRVEESIQELREELRGEIKETREELRGEMQGVREELRDEIKETREELRGEIQGVREELRGEIKEVREELRGEIKEGRAEMGTGFTEVRAEMSSGFQEVRVEIREVRADVHKLDKRVDRISWWVVYGGGLLTLLTLASLVWLLPEPIRGFILGLIGK